MTDTVGFSVGAVARRLGVAPSTLRTWNRRYGIGARELSPGRHRRYTAEDIVRLEHMKGSLNVYLFCLSFKTSVYYSTVFGDYFFYNSFF